ncbi:hypothetical protein [Mesorhizobium shangrilense]|uniref:Uncharacterized protein n=1 Tax=Mesorhizobium shangrilense TaxID=460060 RepID=A0ABV2DQB3_9HYPH
MLQTITTNNSLILVKCAPTAAPDCGPLAGGFCNKHQGHQIKQKVVGRSGECF